MRFESWVRVIAKNKNTRRMSRYLPDLPAPPAKPTVYIVGAAALPDAYANVVPKWARRFGHRSTKFESVDLGPESDTAACQKFIEFMRDEYHAVGAIMITHAAALFDGARHQLDECDGDAELLGEVGVVLRAPGTLHGLAPATSAALRAYHYTFGADSAPPAVLIIGANSSARALALALSNAAGDGAPRQVTLTTLDGKSMTDMRQRVAELPEARRPVLRHIESQLEHDRLVTLPTAGQSCRQRDGARPE